MQKTEPHIILVVDDNEHNRYTATRYLKKAGFEVWESSTGEEALRLAQRQPSLVLLDIKLPDINGFEVCRRIKSDMATAAIPVIHVSATFQGIKDRVQGLEGGADGYITTPVEPEELIATVNAFIRSRQAEIRAQQAQRRLAIAQKAARIGSFEWDLLHNKVSWTPEMELLYGLGPGEFKSTYESWLEHIHPDDKVNVAKNLEATIRQKDDFQMEFRILLPNGGIKWILSRSEIIKDEKGNATQLVGVDIDITDRKQDEEKLREAQTQLRMYATDLEKRVKERTAKLEETIQDLEAFSYSVSHDLRAPLRAMNGYSNYLLTECADKLNPQATNYLERIFSASGRLDQLIQDILTYSRIARADIQPATIDLERLVRAIIQQYPDFHSSKAVIEIDSPLLSVLGYESYVTQCISNILNNSVKFIAPGTTPRIRIWTTAIGSSVRLNFKDNGIGIAPQHGHRVFKMFERIHATKDYEGTGIGLAIVKKAVERMGGEVGLESQVGEGSLFWIQLPRA